MNEHAQVIVQSESVLATNKLIRNTYILLSATLLFSAAIATLAFATSAPMLNVWVTIGGYFGLLFVTYALRNSAWGLMSVFALTGFMGYTLGPIINVYVGHFGNGTQIVAYAMASTGAIFLGLSAYALTTRKDFSFMRGFLLVGVLVLFVAGIANIFLQMPALALAISSAMVLLMSAMILFQTSELVHGGEDNYILATIGLYVSIYNLFLSLLQLFGVFGGDE